MYIFRAVIFIAIMLSALVFVTHFLLGWSWKMVFILLIIGAIFVGGSICGYKKMYQDDD